MNVPRHKRDGCMFRFPAMYIAIQFARYAERAVHYARVASDGDVSGDNRKIYRTLARDTARHSRHYFAQLEAQR